MTRNNQKGQAVLVVLLSLSVVLVIVLFIMSRSVTDLGLSVKDEDALRAFSAAEAGVERALVIGNNSGQIGSAAFNADVTQYAQGETEVVYPNTLKSGENATFWFSRPSDPNKFTGTQIKYCWGDPGTNNSSPTTPALEVTVYYTTTPNDFTTARIARAVLDPYSSRTSSNYFNSATTQNCLINGESFAFQTTLDLDASLPTGLGIANPDVAEVLQYSTARFLYNTDKGYKIGIDVNGNGSVLPSQGEKVVSSGSYGDSNRKVEVYQMHAEVPPVFNNAIFSSSGIVK